MSDSENFQEISDVELAQLLVNSAEPPPDDPEEPTKWLPNLTPKQMEVFFDLTQNLLAPGNRYSGKGFSTGYAAVKHAYDYHNALVLAVVKSKRQALTGGWYSKLSAEILPDFARNVKGFIYRGPRTTAEKDLIIEVQNRYGSWSIIQLMSIMHDQEVEKKTKGIEASLVYVDEINLFSLQEVHSQLANTLGRRNHIPPEAQRLMATCNPDSPKHWVYQAWFVEGKNDPAFRVIEIRKEDNPDPKVEAYYNRLKVTLRNNPTKYKRDIEGVWCEAPDGDAIFGDVFVPDFHVKGDLQREEFLHPRAGIRCVVGLDIGDTNHGVVFLQERVTKDRIIWIAFDEIVHVGKRVKQESLTFSIMSKMQYWSELVGCDFQWSFISDKSAFDRYRSGTGSFDHLEIQKFSKALLPKFSRIKQPIKMLECPKPMGSVSTRSRILIDLLSEERFFVSAKCTQLQDMLLNITGTKEDPFVPNTHSVYKHALDACTYPLLYMNVGGSVVAETAASDNKPQVLAVGG